MAHDSLWRYLQDLAILHAHDHGFSTVQAEGVDSDILIGEKPANCWRLNTSDGVPLLHPLHRNSVMGGDA